MCEKKKLFIDPLYLFERVKKLKNIVFLKFIFSYSKIPLSFP